MNELLVADPSEAEEKPPRELSGSCLDAVYARYGSVRRQTHYEACFRCGAAAQGLAIRSGDFYQDRQGIGDLSKARASI